MSRAERIYPVVCLPEHTLRSRENHAEVVLGLEAPPRQHLDTFLLDQLLRKLVVIGKVKLGGVHLHHGIHGPLRRYTSQPTNSVEPLHSEFCVALQLVHERFEMLARPVVLCQHKFDGCLHWSCRAEHTSRHSAKPIADLIGNSEWVVHQNPAEPPARYDKLLAYSSDRDHGHISSNACHCREWFPGERHVCVDFIADDGNLELPGQRHNLPTVFLPVH
mmetsp:Transcript_10321/g.31569  ORF Transcript_10321/g.31569 Transcript_10321/m.31569 type:complete len:219 (-) Transcript_10321:705-1361(-)